MLSYRSHSRILKAGFLFSSLILIFTLSLSIQGQESDYPIVYTDILGNEVTLTEQPQSIITLAPAVTETLYAIGAGPQIVGRTDYDNYPEEVEDVPSVGGFSGETISIETIISLEPDLIIGGSVYQADLVQIMADSGITMFIVEPVSVADVLQMIADLGAITGNVKGATEVIEDMQERMDAIIEVIDAIQEEDRTTVFYEVWHEPIMTTTGQTYIGEIITLAGGLNIFNDVEGTYPTISAEEIIMSDPAVILGPSSHADQLTVEMIAERDGWQNLSAVTQERVYIVDGDIISRSGPRIIDAIEAVARQLYPDLFEDMESPEETPSPEETASPESTE